jgi:type IV pilus assembly protein PilE
MSSMGLFRQNRGFTLIELMIVVVVVAILTAIALPSFLEQIRKGARAQAKTALLDTMQKEERFFSSNGIYCGGGTACPWTLTPADLTKYAITVTTSSSDQKYIVTATPVTGYSDPTCGTLTVNEQNAKTSTNNSVCW